jgi:Transglycosylase SLT domain
MGFIFGGNTGQSPESLEEARQRLAYEQLAAGSSTAPIRSGWQGAAQLAQAIMGGLDLHNMQAQQNYEVAKLGALYGGPDPGAPPSYFSGLFGSGGGSNAPQTAAPAQGGGSGGNPNYFPPQPNTPANAPQTADVTSPSSVPASGQVASSYPDQPKGAVVDQAPAGINDLITSAVPENRRAYVTNLISHESGFNPNSVSPTGATGLGQFTRRTGAQYGLVGPGFDNRKDPVANINAIVQLTNDNANGLRNALGREPTDGELALAHQQGLGGAIRLLSGQGADPGNLAVNNIAPGTAPQAAANKIMAFYGYGPNNGQQAISNQMTPGAGMATPDGDIQPPAMPGPATPTPGYVDPMVTTAGRIPIPTPRPDMPAAQMPTVNVPKTGRLPPSAQLSQALNDRMNGNVPLPASNAAPAQPVPVAAPQTGTGPGAIPPPGTNMAEDGSWTDANGVRRDVNGQAIDANFQPVSDPASPSAVTPYAPSNTSASPGAQTLPPSNVPATAATANINSAKAPAPVPAPGSPEDIAAAQSKARQAILDGKDPTAVNKYLVDNGYPAIDIPPAAQAQPQAQPQQQAQNLPVAPWDRTPTPQEKLAQAANSSPNFQGQNPQQNMMSNPRTAALFQVMMSPYASASTKQLAGTLLQQTMMPQFDYQTRPDGSVIRINKLSGQADQVVGPMRLSQHTVIAEDPITQTKKYGWVNNVDQTMIPDDQGQPSSMTPPPNPNDRNAATNQTSLPASPTNAPNNVSPQQVASNGTQQPAQQTAPQQSQYDKNGDYQPVVPKFPGEDYLDNVAATNKQWAPYVPYARAIIRGDAAVPVGNAAEKPVDRMVMNLVYAADSKFNGTTRKPTLEDFVNKSDLQSSAGQVVQANTALTNMEKAARASEELGKTQWTDISGNPGGSSNVNWAQEKVSSNASKYHAALQNFNTAMEPLAEELTKFFSGGPGAEASREAIREIGDPNSTPEVRAAKFKTLAAEIQDKTDSLQAKWHTGIGPGVNDFPVIGSKGNASIDYLNSLYPPKLTEKEYNDAPSLTWFTAPDGSTRRKP